MTYSNVVKKQTNKRRWKNMFLVRRGNKSALIDIIAGHIINNEALNEKRFATHRRTTLMLKFVLFVHSSPVRARCLARRLVQILVNRCWYYIQWCHNEHDDVSNHRRPDCLLNSLFRLRSKKTSKIRVAGHCEGNPPVTGLFPSQRVSNAENVSIWWRHHKQCYGVVLDRLQWKLSAMGQLCCDSINQTGRRKWQRIDFTLWRRINSNRKHGL